MWDRESLDESILSSLRALMASQEDVDYIELRLEYNESTNLETLNDHVRHQAHVVEIGGNVRVFHQGAVGFVHFDGWDDLPRHINDAKLLAKWENPSGFPGGSQDSPASADPVYSVQRLVTLENPLKVPLEDKIHLLLGYAELAHMTHPLVKSVTGRYFDRYRHLWFADNRGSAIEQEKLDLGGNIVVMARNSNGTAQRGVSFGSSNDFGVLRNLDDQIKDAALSAVALLDAPEVEGGEYTVVVDPYLAGVFAHEAFGHLSEADGQVGDEGLLEQMVLGRKFGPPNLHIYDTGKDMGSRGYLPFDDEGVPAQDVDLIKDGVLVGRLHSRETAAHLGERPTGNARALHYRFPPIVRMRNTVIAPGDTAFADLFQGIKRGIYAKGTHGGQTNGELFTFLAAEAYLIEDGQITQPVRNAVLTGNVFSTLQQITAIGNDFTRYEGGGGCGKAGQMPLPVSHHAPSLRIERCVVGGRGR
ncbi:MAG: TldD/PmbA family protein [Sulfobacillus thermosulfidooxidans]|uniref:TldD/PmbA family protein n=1 Tax=Sulfobacillus thermosulfidooxidans TaxID=28034 RepID=A0A2T2WYR7_SULTH|nr:MAG: TldD/PmbA family protein [Sulfobacillus thermosulfidooxidans]